MDRQSIERTIVVRGRTPHLPAKLTLAAGLLLSASQVLAEPGPPRSCDLAGTWYGGSVVAYQMTIVPAAAPGRYTVFFQGMYKNSVMNTAFTGELARKHDRYQGPFMQLSTSDPDFLNPPPIGKLPNVVAGWTSMELVDCNTIENRIPLFGVYLSGNIWQPGVVWATPGKTPLHDAPDVDLLDLLHGGSPVVETYRRLPKTVNPALLHPSDD